MAGPRAFLLEGASLVHETRARVKSQKVRLCGNIGESLGVEVG